jgi:hypothetical protein
MYYFSGSVSRKYLSQMNNKGREIKQSFGDDIFISIKKNSLQAK